MNVFRSTFAKVPLYLMVRICNTVMKTGFEITLYVYTGKDGAFTLYEDEGVNYNYEKGQYATIPFAYNDAEGTLVIGDRTGDFPGMLKERTFNVVKVSKDQPQPFDLKAKGTTVKYDGKDTNR